MNPREYTNHVGFYNGQWLAAAFNLTHNHYGIDLCDQKYGIEVKSRLKSYQASVAVHAYQVNQFQKENPSLTLFWAFVFYSTTKPISEITHHNEISRNLCDQEAYILPWDWVRQFPSSTSPKTGPYIYVHKRDFPSSNQFQDFSVASGCIHVLIGTEVNLIDRLSVFVPSPSGRIYSLAP